MKNQINILYLLMAIGMFSGCAVVGGIFKAGMGVGIFLVIAILVIFFFLMSKIGKRN